MRFGLFGLDRSIFGTNFDQKMEEMVKLPDCFYYFIENVIAYLIIIQKEKIYCFSRPKLFFLLTWPNFPQFSYFRCRGTGDNKRGALESIFLREILENV